MGNTGSSEKAHSEHQPLIDKLLSLNMEELHDFINQNHTLEKMSFSWYLYKHLQDKSSRKERLLGLLSGDQRTRAQTAVDIANLDQYPLKAFVEAASRAGLSVFWNEKQHQNTNTPPWLVNWILTYPKETTNDTASWYSNNLVFRELYAMALYGCLYPLSPISDINKLSCYRIHPKSVQCPELSDPWGSLSCMLDPALGWALCREMPQGSRQKWECVYSSQRDGRSWSTFIKTIQKRGSILLIVRNKHQPHGVFGAYLDADIERLPSWHGNSSNFLFTTAADAKSSQEESLAIFPSIGVNQNYQYFNYGKKTLPNGLGVGGQMEYFGLWIDSDFRHGHTNPTATYGSSNLTDPQEFDIGGIEAWLVRPTERLDEDDVDNQKSAVEANPEAAALLEMANRKLYSKQLSKEKPKK